MLNIPPLNRPGEGERYKKSTDGRLYYTQPFFGEVKRQALERSC